MYYGYITKITNIRNHPNADRLDLGTCFGDTVVIAKNSFVENAVGVYFPTDGQVSEVFAKANRLLKADGGYLDNDKRNIKAIRLRGEKSEGLFLPLSCLANFVDIDTLKVGDRFTEFNGVEICRKYIPRRNKRKSEKGLQAIQENFKKIYAPAFKEHIDIEQLMYYLDDYKSGDILQVTLKMHGTSARTGYLPLLKGYKRTFIDWILRRKGKPIYEYGLISGTRKVVLANEAQYEGTERAFRKHYHDYFDGKLNKGETVFYEIVGYMKEGTPIMPSCKNEKQALGEEFVKNYGTETVFNYGCADGYNEAYIYRMNYTTPEGDVFEYSPEKIKRRAMEMRVNVVPELFTFIVPDEVLLEDAGTNVGEYIASIAEGFIDGVDPIGKTHIREGVVVRRLNAVDFDARKLKSFAFKVLEGIIKDTAEVPDVEEAQSEY